MFVYFKGILICIEKKKNHPITTSFLLEVYFKKDPIQEKKDIHHMLHKLWQGYLSLNKTPHEKKCSSMIRLIFTYFNWVLY